jgi:tRNA pseudouridine55 synthase
VQTHKFLFNIYKPSGWTPLRALEHFRDSHPELTDIPLTYAGRLDPLAEGVLILLGPDAIKDKDLYLKLPKKYTAQIIFGVSTDSHDLLGLAGNISESPIGIDQIQNAIEQIKNIESLPLPPFSSVPVKGKPLFEWALSEELDQIEIPRRALQIQSITLKEINYTNSERLLKKIYEDISRVNGNFRQELIKKRWEELLSQRLMNLSVATIDIECSSGTYIRSIANQLGEITGSGATLYHLTRTAVGEHLIEDSSRLLF